MTLEGLLILSAVLFCVGLLGAFTRRNAVVVLFSIEIMLNAANLNFIAFWRYSENPELLHGPLFALFAIAVAAAESVTGKSTRATYMGGVLSRAAVVLSSWPQGALSVLRRRDKDALLPDKRNNPRSKAARAKDVWPWPAGLVRTAR